MTIAPNPSGKAAMKNDSEQWSDKGRMFADAWTKQLSVEFRGLSARAAYRRARRMIEDAWKRYRQSPRSHEVACRTHNCFACCTYQKAIDSSQYEAGRILDRVEQQGRLQEVVDRAKSLVAQGKGGACPLLSRDGKCTVYDIRPLACMSYHSLDRDRCQIAGDMVPKAEKLWIKSRIPTGFGLYSVERLEKGGPADCLFDLLAERGQERLNKKDAA